MTDDQRPDMEWPSEDLARSAPEPKPPQEVEWPSEDRAKIAEASSKEGKAGKPAPKATQPEPQKPAPTPAPEAVQPTPPPPPPAAAPPPPPTPPPPLVEPVAPAASTPEPPRTAVPPPLAVPAAPAEPVVAPEPPPLAEPVAPPTPPAPEPELALPLEPNVPSHLPPPAAPGPYGVSQAPPYGDPPPAATPVQPGPVQAGPYALAGAPDTPDSGGTSSAPTGKSHFRPDIEGLRAVAVIAVLLFHVGLPLTNGGFVGVDVFYVISGFLITGLLLREGEATGKVDLLRFYARRMRRLLPAALVVIVVTLAISAVVVSPLRLTEIAGDAAAAALYVANFRFALEAADYLALEAPSPLLHYWSLGVEEQFYLVWPLILLVATKFLSARFLGVFILILAIASFALSVYWTDTNPAWAFFSPFTRAWELAAGALIAVGLLRIPRRVPQLVSSLAVWVGIGLILLGVFVISDETPFPGVAALLPVVGTVLVIAGGTHGLTLPGKLLGNPLFRYLGRISYSLYLWHWPLLILVPIAIGVDDLTTRLILAGLAIAIAAISTEVIEQPFRRSGALSLRSRGSVQLGLTASVAVGVVALLMTGTFNLPVTAPFIKPDPLVVELAGVRQDLPASYSDGCHLSYEVKKLKTDCVYGDPAGEQTAFLIGDSHAAQWLPAIDAYAAQEGWRLEVHTKSACSVADVPLWERRLRRTYDECIKWRTRLLKRIKEQDPDAVYVGSSRDYELLGENGIIQTRQARGYWQEQLTQLLRDVDRRAGKVVLLAETPFLTYDPVDCLAGDDNTSCDPPRNVVVDAEYAALEQAAADAAGVSLLSANDLLCPGAYCPVAVDDTVVFRDTHHVTASYMTALAEPIGNILEGRAPYPTPAPTPVTAPAIASDGDVAQPTDGIERDTDEATPPPVG